MARGFTITGAVLGFLAVALGAFAAHGLQDRLDIEAQAWFETGVRYHLGHALAVLFCAWAGERFTSRATRVAGWLFVAGILLFSGSLYALALTGARVLGAVTPFGGAAFLAGWVALALGASRGER